jgi:hypothetical protein
MGGLYSKHQSITLKEKSAAWFGSSTLQPKWEDTSFLRQDRQLQLDELIQVQWHRAQRFQLTLYHLKPVYALDV